MNSNSQSTFRSRFYRLHSALLLTVLIACVSTGAMAQQQDLKLGSGDVVRITVYGQDDLNTVVRIAQEGDITFPLIGSVRLAGLSSRQAEQKLENLLSQGKFVRNPQVQLFVQERVSAENEVVTVLGQVKKPGRFAVDTLSNDGAQSIVGLLALAGGVGEDAADYLILTNENAAGGKARRIDLVGLIRDGDLSQNVKLAGGDIVMVPSMDVVFVYGEVQRPGRYRLDRDMTVMQAIAVSGGLTSRGTEKGLSIRRPTNTGAVDKVRAGLDDVVKPNDVVFVGESLF